mgnify:FL=1
MEFTVREFIFHYVNKEYNKRVQIIVELTDHIEKLNMYYILNDNDRIKYLKMLNNITKILNNYYCDRIILINNEDDFDENREDSDKSITNKLDFKINLNNKLSSLIQIPILNINKETKDKILKNIVKMSNVIYHESLDKIQLNEFSDIDKMISDIISEIGCNKISNVLLYYDVPIDVIFKNNELYEIIDKLFIPVKILKSNLNENENNNIIIITNECDDNHDEKYNILLENFYKIEIELYLFKIILFGFFKIDCINSNIRLSKITNQYLYNKRKEFIMISENSSKLKNNKFNNIPNEFKRTYIRNMTIGELLCNDDKSFITLIINEYDFYRTYESMGNFKLLFNEFINEKNLINKFKIIKFLLLSSNSGNICNAGMLFSLTKEQKCNAIVVADIFYKNLNFQLQSKLHKTDINIKNEIEKLNNLDSDDIDLKKQVLMNKNMPSKVKKLVLEKINEMKSGNSEYYKQLTYVKTLVDFPWIGENDGDIFSLHKDDINKWKDIMIQTHNKLNNNIYGHVESKDTIVELLGKWFSNNMSQGKSIGLCGPPGTGKSLLCMRLGEALGIPCVKINLGGMEDSSILCGHGITYSSSVPGLIVKKMVEAGKPRCIFYFD